MESLELEVELPIILKMDISGAVDIANSWSVGSRMHHIDVHKYFLCNLKDSGMLVIQHVARERNDAENFTKRHQLYKTGTCHSR